VANVGWSRQRSASRAQEFQDAESESHQAAPVAVANDWGSVNSVFCLQSDGVFGIQGETVSCGGASNTAAIAQE
jgi:hypothetical protein